MRLQEDLQKIRKTLLKGPQTWGELKDKTKWSPSVLKNRIDLLIERGDLEATIGKRKGRRTTIYKITQEDKARAEITRYEAIKFIESMQEPTYSSKLSEENKIRISVFVSLSPHGRSVMEQTWEINKKLWQKQIDNYTESLLKSSIKLLLPRRLPSGNKVAIVLTKES